MMHQSGFQRRRQHVRQALGGGSSSKQDDSGDNFLSILFGGGGGGGKTSSSSTHTHTEEKTSTTSSSSKTSSTKTSTTSSKTSSSTSTTSSTSSTSSTTSSSSSSTPLVSSSSSSSSPISTPTVPSSTSSFSSENTLPASSSSNPAAAASGTSSTTGASSNTGAIVGGVAAGLAGFVLLLALVAFVVRRTRRRMDQDISFDPDNFRRSAIQIPDEGPAFNPRPPAMTERNNNTMSFGTMYGAPGPTQAEYAQPQYSPSVHSSTMHSANPLFAPDMYGHNLYSPQPSPISANMYTNVHMGVPPAARHLSGMTINTIDSTGPAQYATYPNTSAPPPKREISPLPTPNYATLERSSVTPFQAAQYAEISRRIDSEPPKGLDTPEVEAFMSGKGGPSVPPSKQLPSPFEDPSTPTDTMAHGELDFPVPPSPSVTSSSRYRIDSMPPSLPEIQTDRHSVSSYGFTSPMRNSEIVSFMGGNLGVSHKEVTPSPLGSSFPVTPSPLGTTFNITSPAPVHQATSPLANSFTPAAATSPLSQSTSSPAAGQEKKSRPETVYDEDDVYGGI